MVFLQLDPTKKRKGIKRRENVKGLSPSANGPGENDVVLGVYSTRANSFSLVGLPKENGAVEEEQEDKTQIRFTAKSDVGKNGLKKKG